MEPSCTDPDAEPEPQQVIKNSIRTSIKEISVQLCSQKRFAANPAEPTPECRIISNVRPIECHLSVL